MSTSSVLSALLPGTSYGGGLNVLDASNVASPATATSSAVTFSSLGQMTMSALATGTNSNLSYRVFPYGQGDGSTTFGLPVDWKGRVIGIAGQGSGLTNRTSDFQTGQETVTLTTNEMPAHSHGVSDPGHNHSGVTSGIQAGASAGGGSTNNFTTTGNPTVGASWALSINGNTTGISIAANGSSGAHVNMQPTQFSALSAQIYAGV
jgi:microcystin-dependent protein